MIEIADEVLSASKKMAAQAESISKLKSGANLSDYPDLLLPDFELAGRVSCLPAPKIFEERDKEREAEIERER